MAWCSTDCLVLLLVVSITTLVTGDPFKMGVDYGLLGDNLPPPSQVIPLLQKCGIQQIRIYDPNTQVLDALQNTSIFTYMGVKNEDLAGIAASLDTAKAWLDTYYAPYYQTVQIFQIVVGNEVVPGVNAQYLVPAMRNLRTVLDQNPMEGFRQAILTTSLSGAVLANTYPPSQSTFTSDAIGVMTDLLAFNDGVPLGYRGDIIVHLYPYFARAGDPVNVPLEYAMFESQTPQFQDGNLTYYNLLDAMYDGFVWAMENIGATNPTFNLGETGWPSAGNGDFTSPALAQRYNTNLYNHLASGVGTPKDPQGLNTAFVFALFNENQKEAGIEQNWGLFYPDMSPVYTTPICPQ